MPDAYSIQPATSGSRQNRTLLFAVAAFVTLAVLLFVVLLLLPWRRLGYISSLKSYRVVGNSMAPTVSENDRVMVDQGYYSRHSISDGDIVVFRHNDTILIKRVSAIAGEVIEGREDRLIRNGVKLSEPYITISADMASNEEANFVARKVDEDEIFVTGDNRDLSLDSRASYYGQVSREDVIGKLVYVINGSSYPSELIHKF